jgi:hypothetical protein
LAACFFSTAVTALAGPGQNLVNAIANDKITEAKRVELVNQALVSGAPVDFIENPAFNKTPLIDASYYCRPGVAKVLIDKGANVNHRNNINKPPLAYALGKKCWTIAALLLQSGRVVDANTIVNTPNHENNTPLHFAAEQGNNEMVRLLLAAGADPNAIGYANSVPLHFAAGGKGNSDTVRLLADAGALIRARNASGKSPADLADIFHNQSVADRLSYLDQMMQKNDGKVPNSGTSAPTTTPTKQAPSNSAAPTVPAPIVVAAVPQGAQKCAVDGQTCTLPSGWPGGQVYYGAGNRYVEIPSGAAPTSTSFVCLPTTFQVADPVPNVQKSCYYLAVAKAK